MCGIDFDAFYGRMANGYIEIHHLTPVSMMEAPAIVDPRTDLVPSVQTVTGLLIAGGRPIRPRKCLTVYVDDSADPAFLTRNQAALPVGHTLLAPSAESNVCSIGAPISTLGENLTRCPHDDTFTLTSFRSTRSGLGPVLKNRCCICIGR